MWTDWSGACAAVGVEYDRARAARGSAEQLAAYRAGFVFEGPLAGLRVALLEKPRRARGRCAWLFRREVAWVTLNANAKLKLERAEFIGWDARTARARNAEEANRAGAARAAFAWGATAYEHGSGD